MSCNRKLPDAVRESKQILFSQPLHVTVDGYSGHLMEPFISRDGQYLFFNNLNDPAVNTNIFYALRMNDTLFRFMGEVQGANSLYLDGVASMSSSNRLYFVTTRSYPQNYSTIYTGVFNNGLVSGVELVPGISVEEPGIVDFDAEISSDGETLYFASGRFNQTGLPLTADIMIAKRSGAGFIKQADSELIFKNINTTELEYAAGISSDELTFFFTRLSKAVAGMTSHLYYATRDSKTAPFDMPHQIQNATGFTEAVTVAGDSLLYFHRKDNDLFQLYCLKKL